MKKYNLIKFFLVSFYLLNFFCFSLNENIDLSNQDIEINENQNVKNISDIITVTPLNDSNVILSVKWFENGSPVMVILSKGSKNKNLLKPTNLYISYDYGSTFKKTNLNLPDGKNISINDWFTSKNKETFILFTDIVNNYIIVTNDTGRTYKAIPTPFKPRLLKIHSLYENLILGSANDKVFDLFLSKDYGQNWISIFKNVKKFSWATNYFDKKNRIYIHENETNNLICSDNFFENSKILQESIIDFEICENYMLVKKKNLSNKLISKDSLTLMVSFNKSDLLTAKFDDENLNKIDYQVISCLNNELLIAVKYSNEKTSLFTSNNIVHKFRLILENLVPNNNNQTKNEIHKVAGLNGIYIANVYKNFEDKKSIETKITYNFGYTWQKINISQVQHNETGKCNDCALHLVQNNLIFNHKYPGIMSKNSSAGLILAVGVIDEYLKKNYTNKPETFISKDAGRSWRRMHDSNYLFSIGDRGGVIVGVKSFLKSNVTNELIYSLDDGYTWNNIKFMEEKLKVYSLLNEKEEKTTIFTIFGSLENTTLSWVLVKVNFTLLLNKKCDDDELEFWSPHSPDTNCLMGKSYEFKRRKTSSSCYLGKDFVKNVRITSCSCTREDYVCDEGFKEVSNKSCVPDQNISELNTDCVEGKKKYFSKGFRRINLNECVPPENSLFEPSYEFCTELKVEREIIKTIFLSLFFTTIVFSIGYFGVNFLRNHQKRSTLYTMANTHYNRRTDSAILLDADDLNEETIVKGFSDDVPMVTS